MALSDIPTELASLGAELKDRQGLDDIFQRMIANGAADHAGLYLALMDYAGALAELGSSDAWPFFERAIALQPIQHAVDAITQYALRRLRVDGGKAAISVLDRYLPGQARSALFGPLVVEYLSRAQMGADRSAVENALAAIGVTIPLDYAARAKETAAKAPPTTIEFSHDESSDDCRKAAQGPVPVGASTYNYCGSSPFVVNTNSYNLGEIIWNEARSEYFGAQTAVAWTVRDRAYTKPTCDAYPGAYQNASTCLSKLPCSGNFGDSASQISCDGAKRYCCVEHAGSTRVGFKHQQFNDAHQPISDNICLSTYKVAYTTIRGWTMDVTTGFRTPICGEMTQTEDYCAESYCRAQSPNGATLFDWATFSPNGPQEYRGSCEASGYSVQRLECKTITGYVCAQAFCDPVANPNNFFVNKK